MVISQKSRWFVALLMVSSCGHDPRSPANGTLRSSSGVVPVTSTDAPGEVVPLQGSSASKLQDATPHPEPNGICLLSALPAEPDRGYCFSYFDNESAPSGLCDQLKGTWTKGGSCPMVGHQGTCVLPDGTERWSYAPATVQVAERQCAPTNGTFYKPGQPIPPHSRRVLSCSGQVRGLCSATTVASDGALAFERQRCIDAGGTAKEGADCPTKGRVGSCRSLMPGLIETYYAPEFSREAAQQECLGSFIPQD